LPFWFLRSAKASLGLTLSLQALEAIFVRKNKHGFNAGMVLKTPASSEEKTIWSTAGLESPALEEGNEQKVSDTPCLSVIAGLIHTGVAKSHT